MRFQRGAAECQQSFERMFYSISGSLGRSAVTHGCDRRACSGSGTTCSGVATCWPARRRRARCYVVWTGGELDWHLTDGCSAKFLHCFPCETLTVRPAVPLCRGRHHKGDCRASKPCNLDPSEPSRAPQAEDVLKTVRCLTTWSSRCTADAVPCRPTYRYDFRLSAAFHACSSQLTMHSHC